MDDMAAQDIATAQPGWTSAGGYLCGFGAHFASEAHPGALPVGRNSPQKAPYGLYAELISGSAFTAPRAENRRTWTYRLRPSAGQRPFRPYDGAPLLRSGPFDAAHLSPNRLRWSPLAWPAEPVDFVDGLITFGGAGAPEPAGGVAIHQYLADRPMTGRAFVNADGEMLVVPQAGRLAITTELGRLDVAPGQIVLLPRGLRFRVDLPDGRARGYVCENYGAYFRLPELGPIGSNGLASPRDFESPAAGFEDLDGQVLLIEKLQGRLWQAELDHSPFDVVAWHGNHVPYRYDLARFMSIGTVSHDHPDPSINTVLTSPSDTPGVANVDFVVFAPRWLVAEGAFRPPWFHRNVMSEFMGLIRGAYDAKAEGFEPGGASLHNAMSAHGPDLETYIQAISAELAPQKIEDSYAFMFETRSVIRPTRFAVETAALQDDYDACWRGFPKADLGGSPA